MSSSAHRITGAISANISASIDTNFRDAWQWPFARRSGDIVSVRIQGRLRFANTEACLQAAIAGLGIARLPYPATWRDRPAAREL